MSERRTWGSWVLLGTAAVVLFVLGALAGASSNDASTQDAVTELAEATEDLSLLRMAQENLEERNWNLYLENTALRSELDSSAVDAGVPSDAEDGVFGDGIWDVGSQIEPGTYDGTVVYDSGYWARLKNTTGMVNGIIANGVPRGPFVLTINPSDEAVELRGVVLTSR